MNMGLSQEGGWNMGPSQDDPSSGYSHKVGGVTPSKVGGVVPSKVNGV